VYVRVQEYTGRCPMEGMRRIEGPKSIDVQCASTDYHPGVQESSFVRLGRVRIPIREDRRVFTPVARSSYTWKRLYAKRSAVERVNSRLDVSFGFERHYIRGLAKMRMRCTLALCIMTASAIGRIKAHQPHLMRSLVCNL
jgi:hypothetical protein